MSRLIPNRRRASQSDESRVALPQYQVDQVWGQVKAGAAGGFCPCERISLDRRITSELFEAKEARREMHVLEEKRRRQKRLIPNLFAVTGRATQAGGLGVELVCGAEYAGGLSAAVLADLLLFPWEGRDWEACVFWRTASLPADMTCRHWRDEESTYMEMGICRHTKSKQHNLSMSRHVFVRQTLSVQETTPARISSSQGPSDHHHPWPSALLVPPNPAARAPPQPVSSRSVRPTTGGLILSLALAPIYLAGHCTSPSQSCPFFPSAACCQSPISSLLPLPYSDGQTE